MRSKVLLRMSLIVGKMQDPQPQAGGVRIRIAFSGINPGDVKKREDAFGVGMPYPRVIPHSDGSGTVDAVGDGVSKEWIRRRVWCLWCSILPSFRNRRRVHRRSCQTGHSSRRERAAGAGCMSRHSRHHRSSRCSCRRFSRRTNRPSTRRGRGGRNVCRSTRASSGSPSHRYQQPEKMNASKLRFRATLNL